jgi:hypothetical protein
MVVILLRAAVSYINELIVSECCLDKSVGKSSPDPGNRVKTSRRTCLLESA